MARVDRPAGSCSPSIPAEIVFNPNWWFRNCGISFDESFYMGRRRRIEADVKMRQVLYSRFGMGKPDPSPRPTIGSQHIAGGFVVPALLGVKIRFTPDQGAEPVAQALTRAEALSLRAPDVRTTWPMSDLIADMDALEREFGYVVGDLNTGGLLNTALELRGNRFLVDLVEDPELADHLFRAIAQTQVAVAKCIQERTGTSSISVNRSIVGVDPRIYLHGDCSVQMISPALFRQRVLPYQQWLAERLQPYGVHFCGGTLHKYLESYGALPLRFMDVGWGSDVARCSRALPNAFLNLRLSPLRMVQAQTTEIVEDVERILAAAGRTHDVGICCINMDYGTPDENITGFLEEVRVFESRLTDQVGA